MVTAPREKPLPGPARPEPPADLTARWTDPDYTTAVADHAHRHTYYGGEAIPASFINLGPGIMATYFGSEPVFAPDTVWFQPVPFAWDDFPRFDPTSRWWRLTQEMTRRRAEALAGQAWVGLTDLGGASDVLAALRGTEALLLDMALNPEPIPAAMEVLTATWRHCFDELWAITREHAEGCVMWLGLWAPGRMYNIQSDFCCMVSPAMFEWFIAPELETLCRFLDHSLYHLDGPDALKHLDRLLAIPELGGIQWTPGAGHPPTVEWLPMLKKVQAAGKRLHLHGPISDAERLLRALRPEGVVFHTAASTEEEARDLLRQARVWAAGPRTEG
jgi:hypothetical protein